MARPPSDDPAVPLPVRLPRSLIERLRREAEDQGDTLTALVRRRLDTRTGVDPRTVPTVVRATLDKTEHVDLRPGGALCECDKPVLSKVAPICTACGRRRP